MDVDDLQGFQAALARGPAPPPGRRRRAPRRCRATTAASEGTTPSATPRRGCARRWPARSRPRSRAGRPAWSRWGSGWPRTWSWPRIGWRRGRCGGGRTCSGLPEHDYRRQLRAPPRGGRPALPLRSATWDRVTSPARGLHPRAARGAPTSANGPRRGSWRRSNRPWPETRRAAAPPRGHGAHAAAPPGRTAAPELKPARQNSGAAAGSGADTIRGTRSRQSIRLLEVHDLHPSHACSWHRRCLMAADRESERAMIDTHRPARVAMRRMAVLASCARRSSPDRGDHDAATTAITIAVGSAPAPARGSPAARATTRMDVLVRFRQAPGDAERGAGPAPGRPGAPPAAPVLPLAVRSAFPRTARGPRRRSHRRLRRDRRAGLDRDGHRPRGRRTARRLPRRRARSRAPASSIAVVDSGVALHPDIQTLTAVVDVVAQPAAPPAARPRTASTPTATAPTWPASWSATAACPGAACAASPPRRAWSRCACSTASAAALTSDVLAGLQWIRTNHAEYGIRVVNLSLGPPGVRAGRATTRWWKRSTRSGTPASWWSAPRATAAADGHVTITSPCNSPQGDHRRRDQRRRTPDITRRQDRDLLVARADGVRPRRQARPRRPGQPHRVPALARARTSTLLLPDRRVAADPAQPAVAGLLRDVGDEHGLADRGRAPPP